MRTLIKIYCVLFVLMFSRTTDASFIGMVEFKIIPVEQKYDSLPPSAPILALQKINRGHGHVEIGGRIWSTANDETGAILVSVGDASDNRTPADSLGDEFLHVSGVLPDGLTLPSKAYYPIHFRNDDRNILCFYWKDGTTWEQDAFSFKIAVVAVDRAGNKSPASNVVAVSHDGDLHEYREKYIRDSERMLREVQVHVDSTRAEH